MINRYLGYLNWVWEITDHYRMTLIHIIKSQDTFKNEIKLYEIHEIIRVNFLLEKKLMEW